MVISRKKPLCRGLQAPAIEFPATALSARALAACPLAHSLRLAFFFRICSRSRTRLRSDLNPRYPETHERMWTDHARHHYGQGFMVEETPHGKLVGHNGGFPGLNAKLDIHVDAGWVVAVAANHDGAVSPTTDVLGAMLSRVH